VSLASTEFNKGRIAGPGSVTVKVGNFAKGFERESLTSEEAAELAGILELNQIFTLLNAKTIAES
jgi:hypothetical protein